MSKNAKEIDFSLRRLRRHGALLLGSRAAADRRIERVLNQLPGDPMTLFEGQATSLFWAFHQLDPAIATVAPVGEDFAADDRRLVSALHKISLGDRALLLLRATEGFDEPAASYILNLPLADVRARAARARMLLEASLAGRLCMIVEDDLIAMRDLQAEVVQGGLSIGGAAGNLTDALKLTDQIRPDIGIIDLALPEGTMAGLEIADHLKKRCGSRIVFVTAFDQIAKAIARPEDAVVAKPWSRPMLSRALAAASL